MNNSDSNREQNKNIHDGHRDRMRQKCLKFGCSSFQTHELLEMMLYYCIPIKDTNPLAHKMLNEYGSLNALLDAQPKDMMRRLDISERIAVFFTILSEMMKRCNQERWSKKVVLTDTTVAGEFCVSLLSYEKQECFYAILLDSQNRLISSCLISRGTVDETHVYPRAIVEAAIMHSASSVILAHNHPGGRMEPSLSDMKTTLKILNALNAIDIFVIDHIIVGDNTYLSLADRGMVKNKIDKSVEE